MHDNFFLILAAILCLPIVPAFIIYKFLPESETQVEGPYNKLNLKLKGAFAGYFLLVLIGVGLQWAVANNRQTRQIEALTRTMAEQDSLMSSMKTTMAASANPVID
jgi:hypothetical protein